MSSSNSLDVEQEFTVFVDRAPIPDEGNSLILIIVIVVIVLLVVVITGKMIVVMMIAMTRKVWEYILKCRLRVLKKVMLFMFSETIYIDRIRLLQRRCWWCTRRRTGNGATARRASPTSTLTSPRGRSPLSSTIPMEDQAQIEMLVTLFVKYCSQISFRSK